MADGQRGLKRPCTLKINGTRKRHVLSHSLKAEFVKISQAGEAEKRSKIWIDKSSFQTHLRPLKRL